MTKRKFVVRTHNSQSKQKANRFSHQCLNHKRFNKNTLLNNLASDSERYITSLSKVNLSTIEKIALGKGLNFVPTPAKPTRKKLLSDFNIFRRRMRIAFLIKQNSKTPLVFSTTYNPYINHGDLNKAIKNNWSLIQCHETLSRIFPEPPFIAYRKDQNIREKMVRAKLNQSPIDSSPQKLTLTPQESGFLEDPDETLNILISLLEEQFTSDEDLTHYLNPHSDSQPSP